MRQQLASIVTFTAGVALVLGCSTDADDDATSQAEAANAGKDGASGGSGGTGPSGGSAGAGKSGGSSGSGGSSVGAGTAGSSGDGGTGGTGGVAGMSGKGGTSGKAGSAGASGSGGEAGQAPASTWVNATGNLAGMESECGNLTLVSAMPNSSVVIAGVAQKGLFSTTDRGATWTSLGTGAGSAVITNRPSAIVYDPEHPVTFWESGIYNGGGVYRTDDAGDTFLQLSTVSHNDLVSVDFTDPDRKTLLVGGHEQKQTLYLSTNGGDSFDQIGMNLPADSHFSSDPLLLDAETFLVGSCGYGDGACGVYRSTDGGDTWDRATDLAATGRPLVAADGAIYWPLIYDSGLARSTDSGMTWEKVADGLVTSQPVELPDGRLMTVRGTHVVVSADQGSTWDDVGDEIPFKPSGVTYSVAEKSMFVWHWDCGDVVLDDAIASAGFDYTLN